MRGNHWCPSLIETGLKLLRPSCGIDACGCSNYGSTLRTYSNDSDHRFLTRGVRMPRNPSSGFVEVVRPVAFKLYSVVFDGPTFFQITENPVNKSFNFDSIHTEPCQCYVSAEPAWTPTTDFESATMLAE